MFGYRADGVLVKNMDPFDKIVAYVMPRRCDAQVFTEQSVDYDVLSQYARAQKNKGEQVSIMAIVIAAVVRLLSQRPELNRFCVNKRIYARKHLCVSFTVLKTQEDREYAVTTAKVYFDPADTVYDVSRRINKAIEETRYAKEKNAADSLAAALMNMPLLATLLVGAVKLCDRYGLLPKAIIHASPFHTSLFIANMASVRMGHNFHHIYDFGTTSVFCSMGIMERRPVADHKGEILVKQLVPLGFTTDERTATGAQYSSAFARLNQYLKNPAQLETPPEKVFYDGYEFHA